MTKSKARSPKTGSDIFQKDFEPKTRNNIDIKEPETVITDVVAVRDSSSIFARLKKSARKKSAGIL